MVHKLFDVNDASGALQHASKKILLSGVRTGGKSKLKDIVEARDALNRWIAIHQHEYEEPVASSSVAPSLAPKLDAPPERFSRVQELSQIPQQLRKSIDARVSNRQMPVDMYVEVTTGKKMYMVMADKCPTSGGVLSWYVLYSDGVAFREVCEPGDLLGVAAWLTSMSRPASWPTRGRRCENVVNELSTLFKKPLVLLP
ncbi:hypothetical protein Knedl_CDS0007 [Pseudomonas phage Knedl]|nr:hypothetical protein Knedl_CDS0007 [Pseudomonas phage Knedl]